MSSSKKDCDLKILESEFSSDHAEFIAQFRKQLANPKINKLLTDHDCIRFLRARSGSYAKAVDMAIKWYNWRHTEMASLPPTNIKYTPNNLMFCPEYVDQHRAIHLLPVTHYGFDKEGCPIYWEKTGFVQSRFTEVRKHFEVSDLLQYHIQSQEALEIRLKYASKKFGKRIEKAVCVFDFKHLTMTLDFDSISYIKGVLESDQANYPERLKTLYMINCPWYFKALYNIFTSFIDAKTADKFRMLGSDYLPILEEAIDRSQIPVDMGGLGENVPWGGPFHDSSGCSHEQIMRHLSSVYTPDTMDELLTERERAVMIHCLKVNKDPMVREIFGETLEEIERRCGADSGLRLEYKEGIEDRSISVDTCGDAENAHDMNELIGFEVDLSSLETSISETEAIGNSHHLYVIRVKIQVRGIRASNDSASKIDDSTPSTLINAATTVSPSDPRFAYEWVVKKRYSEFVAFRSALKRILLQESLSMENGAGFGGAGDLGMHGHHHNSSTTSISSTTIPSLPNSPDSSVVMSEVDGTPHYDKHKIEKVVPRLAPKVYWGKMSQKVVQERSRHLNEFLAATLNKSKGVNSILNSHGKSLHPDSALPALVHKFLDPLGQNLTRYTKHPISILSLSPSAANNLRKKHRTKHFHAHSHAGHAHVKEKSLKRHHQPTEEKTNKSNADCAVDSSIGNSVSKTDFIPKGDIESNSIMFGIAYIAIFLSVLLGILIHADISWESLI